MPKLVMRLAPFAVFGRNVTSGSGRKGRITADLELRDTTAAGKPLTRVAA